MSEIKPPNAYVLFKTMKCKHIALILFCVPLLSGCVQLTGSRDWSYSQIQAILSSDERITLDDIQWIQVLSNSKLEVTLTSDRRPMSGYGQEVTVENVEGKGWSITNIEHVDF
jgi:hypothetical protein